MQAGLHKSARPFRVRVNWLGVTRPLPHPQVAPPPGCPTPGLPHPPLPHPQVAPPPGCPTPGLPHPRVAPPPGCPTPGLPHPRVAPPPGCPTPGLPHPRVAPPRASPPTHVTTHFRCPSTSRTRCMWIPGMGGVATPSGSLASATPALANPPTGGSSSPGMGSPLHSCTAPTSLGMGGYSTTAPRCPRWHRATGCSPSSAPFLRIA